MNGAVNDTAKPAAQPGDWREAFDSVMASYRAGELTEWELSLLRRRVEAAVLVGDGAETERRLTASLDLATDILTRLHDHGGWGYQRIHVGMLAQAQDDAKAFLASPIRAQTGGENG